MKKTLLVVLMLAMCAGTMTLSTRICLMRNGLLQQYAPPLQVYREPHNTFVADFVGSPSINLVQATVQEQTGNNLRLAGKAGTFVYEAATPLCDLRGKEVTLGIRPEHMRLEGGSHQAIVHSSLPSGMETIVQIELGGQKLHCVMFGDVDYQVGAQEDVQFISNRICLFDGQGTLLSLGKLT